MIEEPQQPRRGGRQLSDRVRLILELAAGGKPPSAIARETGASLTHICSLTSRARSNGANIPRHPRRGPPPSLSTMRQRIIALAAGGATPTEIAATTGADYAAVLSALGKARRLGIAVPAVKRRRKFNFADPAPASGVQ